MIEFLLVNFAVLLAAFIVLWLISLAIKDASIVDIFWGPACALPAMLTCFRSPAHMDWDSLRGIMLTGLVTLWGLRLCIYLASRNLGRGEDFRYVQMRKRSGGDTPFAFVSFFQVFLLQCIVAFFVSLPTQVGQFGTSYLKFGDAPVGPVAIFGLIVFLIGFGFEAIGDFQLQKFKADPKNKGKLNTGGLWGWTRHPNYFGNAAIWTGLTIIALESHLGIWTILSPVVMVFFLYAVSGKAMLERSMMKRYADYPAYKKRVSGFIPMPQKMDQND